MVTWLPGGPDIVVEIDFAPVPASVPASAQKLAFSRDAGEYPLWVRCGKGGIKKIGGVMALDIRDAGRGVREAGS
ncbi:hypothetical protein SXIM_48950 [Streptomyces xiamenensis]|uniref:Uncharacterized protein n=1 Tax=Streptomyces xiamenensis TaxID=408015 RepID=A0A0F7FZX2_9ACTN|nr:hypothetical protein SXIM_48950 [Streptomyces xiamenensis]